MSDGFAPTYGSVVAVDGLPGEYLSVSTANVYGQIAVRRIERWHDDGYPETRGILTPDLDSVTVLDKEVSADFLIGTVRG